MFGAEDLVNLGYRNHLLNSDSDETEDSRANEGFLDLATWFAPQFGIELTSNFARWEFQQPRGFTGTPTEDFYSYGAGLTMNYRWRPQRILYAKYNIDYQDFDDEVGANNDDYMVHRPVLGLAFKFDPNTEFQALVGYFRQDFENGDKGADGFVFDFSFNTRREKTSFRVESESGYNLDYGSSENQGFSKFSDSSARVDYELTENFGIFATARYRWEDFTETNRTDHTYGGRAGLTYSFRRWLTASLEGGHLRRDSDEEENEFTDNRVTLSITAEYPIPFGGN
jgi:hypothetical protein